MALNKWLILVSDMMCLGGCFVCYVDGLFSLFAMFITLDSLYRHVLCLYIRAYYICICIYLKFK
jgi:hypothetical protein